MLSKQVNKYKEIIPLAQLIWDMHIGKSELMSFKIAVNEAAETYGFPRSTAAVYVLNNLKKRPTQKGIVFTVLAKVCTCSSLHMSKSSTLALAKKQDQGL